MWFAVIGIGSLLLSFLYLFRPGVIEAIDEFGKKAVITSEKLLEKRKEVGVFYLIAGILLIFIATWW